MSRIYTVTADYGATGEGHTLMLLITRGYGSDDGPSNALERFREIFGDYFAQGADVEEGLQLNKHYVRDLVPESTRLKLMTWESSDDAPGGLEYFAQLHVNFS
jgi:hypothetical protein